MCVCVLCLPQVRPGGGSAGCWAAEGALRGPVVCWVGEKSGEFRAQGGWVSPGED